MPFFGGRGSPCSAGHRGLLCLVEAGLPRLRCAPLTIFSPRSPFSRCCSPCHRPGCSRWVKFLQFSYLGISLQGCFLLLAVSSSPDSALHNAFLSELLGENQTACAPLAQRALPRRAAPDADLHPAQLPLFALAGPAPPSCPPRLAEPHPEFAEGWWRAAACPAGPRPSEKPGGLCAETPAPAAAPRPAGSPSSKASPGNPEALPGQEGSRQQRAAAALPPGRLPRLPAQPPRGAGSCQPPRDAGEGEDPAEQGRFCGKERKTPREGGASFTCRTCPPEMEGLTLPRCYSTFARGYLIFVLRFSSVWTRFLTCDYLNKFGCNGLFYSVFPALE